MEMPSEVIHDSELGKRSAREARRVKRSRRAPEKYPNRCVFWQKPPISARKAPGIGRTMGGNKKIDVKGVEGWGSIKHRAVCHERD